MVISAGQGMTIKRRWRENGSRAARTWERIHDIVHKRIKKIGHPTSPLHQVDSHATHPLSYSDQSLMIVDRQATFLSH